MYIMLIRKLENFPDLRVKEMEYNLNCVRKIFWLARNSEKQWVVISDVTVPPGHEF